MEVNFLSSLIIIICRKLALSLNKYITEAYIVHDYGTYKYLHRGNE